MTGTSIDPTTALDPTIDELMIGDDPKAWAQLGFEVSGDCCRLGDVNLRLVGGGEGRGLLSWSLRDLRGTNLDGLNTARSSQPARSTAPTHPNGVTKMDHIVAISPALDRSILALQSAGLNLRRVREQPTPAGAPRQAFFRLGDTILELVQEPDEVLERTGDSTRPAHFWGLALRVEDLEGAIESFEPHISPIRAAVQEGRQIATLRRSAGLGVPVALITPPLTAQRGL
jgi:hypothetical protein